MDAKKLDPLYDKEVKCLFCEHKFTTKKVRSRAAVPYQIDSDFCPHYKEGVENPLYYFINVCPECGFAFYDEFTPYMNPRVRQNIQKNLADKWEKRDYGKKRNEQQGIATLKLALLTATLKEEKHTVIGSICLRLAWIYRARQDRAEEERFLRLALQEFERGFMESDFDGTSMTEMKIMYMIGELNRRLGNHQQALNYFSRVIEHPMKHEDPRTVNFAREQWRATVEEHRELKKKSSEEEAE